MVMPPSTPPPPPVHAPPPEIDAPAMIYIDPDDSANSGAEEEDEDVASVVELNLQVSIRSVAFLVSNDRSPHRLNFVALARSCCWAFFARSLARVCLAP